MHTIEDFLASAVFIYFITKTSGLHQVLPHGKYAIQVCALTKGPSLCRAVKN